jgi:Listeria-Bacteroides repeat domain (List_Bact_rpt).
MKKLAGNTCMDPGYTFIGWNTEKDGSGTSYSDEQQVKNIYDKYGYSITLYAQWKANNTQCNSTPTAVPAPCPRRR